MDTALPPKFPFILDRNLAKSNCTENRVCTSCVTVVLGNYPNNISFLVSLPNSNFCFFFRVPWLLGFCWKNTQVAYILLNIIQLEDHNIYYNIQF